MPPALPQHSLGQVDVGTPGKVEGVGTQRVSPRERDALHEREVLVHEEGRDGMGCHGGVPEEVVEERVELAHAQGREVEQDEVPGLPGQPLRAGVIDFLWPVIVPERQRLAEREGIKIAPEHERDFFRKTRRAGVELEDRPLTRSGRVTRL